MRGSKKYFLFFIVLLAIRHPYIHASPETENLYVDGFNSVLEEWDETGASPWLNDNTENYRSTNIDEEWHEEFTYADSAGSGTLNDVFFHIELYGPSGRNDYIQCYIWDEADWNLVLSQDPDDDAYSWYSVNVSSVLDTWIKVDGAKLKIQYQRSGSPSTETIYARRSYLEIDYTLGVPPPKIDPPSDPELLFGAGFNTSSPYVELHWNHSLTDVQFFEVQNSSDGESWTYLGQSNTANYTDSQVTNGTERYYRVRACNQTDSTWYNSSFSDVNFEKVNFILGFGNGGVPPPVDDYSVIFLAVGLILMLAIAFLYIREK